MSSLLKKYLGENLYQTLKSIKRKYFPSQLDRQTIYNERILEEKRIALFSSFIQPGELCFDVGANIGNRVSPLLKIGAKIVAIEPQRYCYRILEKKFGDRITLVKKGVGEKEGIREFYIADDSVLSTFSKEWVDQGKTGRFKGRSWNKVIKMEMTTLDLLLKEYGVPVFIKVDVEGFELEVLKGLTSPIRCISFEYAVPEHLDKAIACIDRLIEINNDIECNFSIGESMELAFDEWLPAEAMKIYAKSSAFLDSFFGDVYVRRKPGTF